MKDFFERQNDKARPGIILWRPRIIHKTFDFVPQHLAVVGQVLNHLMEAFFGDADRGGGLTNGFCLGGEITASIEGKFARFKYSKAALFAGGLSCNKVAEVQRHELLYGLTVGQLRTEG